MVTTTLKKLDLFGKRIYLRFQGESIFQTWCGVFATIFMIISLTYQVVKEGLHIYNGKITSLNYMITSTKENDFNLSIHSNKFLYFGFAFDNPEIDSTFINYNLVLTKQGSTQDTTTEWSPVLCNDEIFNNLSHRSKQAVPVNLNIMCYKIPIAVFKEGFLPNIRLKECTDIKAGCASKDRRIKLLKDYSV